MTNKIVVIALVAVGMSCSSDDHEIEESSVPKSARTALSTAFPDADDIEWEKEGEDFEASFENGKVEMSVVFGADGGIIETEKEIKVSEFPQKVQEALKGEKVEEAAIIMKNGKTMYEAEVGGKDLLFDEDGNQL